MNPLLETPAKLKGLWIGVLKQGRPELAMDDQGRDPEQFTQHANRADASRDEFALRVLAPKGQLTPLDARKAQRGMRARSNRSPLGEPEAFGILWAACAVVCLLLYVIVDVLRETVGRNISLSFLVVLTASVLWWIIRKSRLSYSHKTRWVAAVASGTILIAISLFDSRPRVNPLFPSAHAATAQAQAPVAAFKDSAHQAGAPQKSATVMPPKPERAESLGKQLSGYIETAKNQVTQKWSASEVAAGTPPGATVYIQFAILRRGNHKVPTMESSSGYPSLDASCLRAVDRIRTFDHLPTRYSGDSLIVLYHCTYPSSSTTTFAQDSISPPVQQAPAHGSVDAAHGGQQSSKSAAVTN